MLTPPRPLVRHLAGTIAVLGMLAACGGSSSDGDAAVTTSDTVGEVSVTSDGDDPSITVSESAGSCSVEPDTELVGRISEAILSRYEEGAPIDTTIVSSECVGDSACVLHTTNPGVLSLARVVVFPNGEFLLERELGDTPEQTGDVLAQCFSDAALEPTPDDVALVQTAMWSTFLSLTPSELPPEGIAALTDDALSDFSLDFDNYAGPIVEEVDGVRTVVFVAEDKIANWYVVETVLEPDVGSEVSVVYVG